MKFVNQNIDMPKWKSLIHLDSRKASELERGVKEVVRRKYGESDYSRKLLELVPILHLLGDLEGKTILNLGCGAKESWDYDLGSGITRKKRMYEPWLCRELHELGAKVIGVDGGASQGEEFEFHQLNLMSSGNFLDSLPDSSIDLACAFSLFDSPSLHRGRDLFEFFVRKLRTKVKPQGYFFFGAEGTDYCDKDKWQEFLANYAKQSSREASYAPANPAGIRAGKGV